MIPTVAVLAILLVFSVNGTAAGRSKGGKMPAQPIKLYYHPVSTPCRSVRMTANILGVPLELELVDLTKGEQLKPEFIKINPQHTVPTIDDGGFILWESRAIMTYLVNSYGRNDSLYPRNNRQRALIDQRLYYDIHLHEKFKNLYFLGQENAEVKMNESLDWLNTMLEGKAFVAGDDLTIADISIAVLLSNLEAMGFDYKAHENVVEWFERMKKELEPYGYEEIDKKGAEELASFLKKE